LRLFAYALLGTLANLAMCDSASCVEEDSANERAAALAAAGHPAEAIDVLTRAVNSLRRSGGLYDTRQYALLNQLAELHSVQGDIDEAFAALSYIERISEHTHGRQSTLHAGTLAGVAGWHCRLGRFESGRQRFRRSIERLRHAGSEQLIGALLGLARCSFAELASEGVVTSAVSLDYYRGPVLRTNRMSIGSPTFQYRVQKILRPDAEQALRYAAQLAETGTMPAERRVQVLVQVGDWFQAKDHSRTARRYYASAQRWVQRTVAADDPFAAPVQVLYPVPPRALHTGPLREPSAAQRYVEVEFTVRADGRIDRERVVTRDPGKSAADETLQALQAARYRPRMVEGAALDTEGVRFRQAFR
jgi:tetratricopeptide (TPR) repeat protein